MRAEDAAEEGALVENDPALSAQFALLSDQKLPFELVKAVR